MFDISRTRLDLLNDDSQMMCLKNWRLQRGPWQADGSIREWSRKHVKGNRLNVVFVEDNKGVIR
jgi:hypothetical protein